ncbi:uncharacterized protein LOC110694603 [Chenopodium quinoa]|uniref:uncharacterized protein LOC110694603 n=1 Tax=Chenopodium quinoa TaxID=63459 RepID=UPI000B76F42B|nr:uncharacterized protein LOC110694603 [Chenopodium quinoa]
MIVNAIKNQLGEGSREKKLYEKPYSKRISKLKIPKGYQPPKFQQFDGKGNPKQHIAHFIETCNNAGTAGDLLVKQFVRSLKGIAFDWYTDLPRESIDSWDDMEEEFKKRFYCTRRIVSMTQLTKTEQWEDGPVLDYISRWRALSLECKDLKISGKPKSEQKRESSLKDANTKREEPTLKELQEKKYPFPDSDSSGMLDDLLEKKIIELPESKRPKKMGRSSDPNYCRYHRLVSHPLEKCITLKEKIMRLAKEGRVVLDLDEKEGSNHTTVAVDASPCERHAQIIQFGSLEPVVIQVMKSSPTLHSDPTPLPYEEEEEGWTLVTRRKAR